MLGANRKGLIIMRIVAAHCSAIYSGRGSTTLGTALRALIIKADGSVSIHNDASNKPLNYMKCATFTETEDNGLLIWNFDARQENLRIIIHEIVSDVTVSLVENDEGLLRDGTEAHLQAWLAYHPEALGEGYTLVQREFPTGHGPVDLLVLDETGAPVAVEVKRVAMPNAVYQVKRYVDALGEVDGYGKVRGMIAALDIRPRAQELAEKRKIQTVTLPNDWNETHEA